ncbi:MAG: hypothetical protein NTZ26_01260 [Candidatus Aminicenantes bacterium]|nr:hypothetical protein [Candidatus Aminicenantes bacterium]
MRKPSSTAAVGILLAASGGLTLWLALLRQSPAFSILGHGLLVKGRLWFPLLALWAAFFFGLALSLQLLARSESLASGRPEEERFRAGALALWPLAGLLFAPALLRDFLSRDDFRIRLWLCLAFALAAAVYLGLAERRSLPVGPKAKKKKRGIGRRFLALPIRRRLLVLGLAAFLLYAGAAVLLVREGVTFSGDEPNYLLNADSLLSDHDINLANNYAERDYFHFYSQKADPRLRLGMYAREGKKGPGHVYPINLPGVSALMVPFYTLGQAFGDSFARTAILKGSLIIWAVLLGLQLYLLARELWKREGLALGLWAVYAFSTPVLFYAVHLYPEIPIALFSIYIYRMVRSGRALKSLHLAFLGLLLGSFFWFGLKYNLIFWPLLAVAAFDLWKTQRPRAKILWLVGPALLGLVLFYFGVWTMYGTISPFAVYEGAITGQQAQAITKSFMDLPHSARVDTFLDYFLDQRDGLFLYAPFWLFALLGFVEMGRKARGELIRLLLIASPFVLNYAFFTHRQGFCPQGRVLTPISWIGAVAVGYFLAYTGNRVFRWLFGLAAAAGAAISGILLTHPQFLYQPTTHDYTRRAGDLFIHLSNMRFYLPPLLPSFIKVENRGYLPNLVWVGILVLFVAAYLVFGRKATKPLSPGFHTGTAALLLTGALAMWTAFPRPALSAAHKVDFPSGGRLGFYLEQAGSGVIPGPDGSLYLHFPKSYTIYFASREPLTTIELNYGSLKGSHRASMSLFDVPLLADRTDGETKTLVFRPAAVYQTRGLSLYLLNISLEQISKESMLEAPYRLRIIPRRAGLQPKTMDRISSGVSTR